MKFEKAVPVWAKALKDERNIMLAFDGKFNFNGGKCVLRAAADNFYRVFVNGVFVHFGPEKCGKSFWREDVIELSGHLRKGKNDIHIDVVHYNALAYYYCEFREGFLQAEIVCDGKPALWTSAEGGGFKVRRNLSKEQAVQRFSFQRPMIESYSLPFVYGKQLELEKVTGIRLRGRSAGYPDFSSVRPMLLCEKDRFIYDEDSAPHFDYHGLDVTKHSCDGYRLDEIKTLYSDIVKRLRETGAKKFDKAIDEKYRFELKKGQAELVKLAHESTGFFAAEIDAAEDSEIYITYSEILNDGKYDPLRGGMCSVLPLRIKAGKYSFMGFEPSTAHYIKIYCLDGNVSLSDFRLVEYKNCEARRAEFTCDDPMLCRVFEAARETFAQNTADMYMDCPSRERAGWLCDSFFTSRVEKDLTGGSDMEHDFLENFLIAPDFDLPEGMLPMCYPSARMGGFIPNWAMWYVLELREYYRRTGDRRMITLAHDRVYALKRYFDAFIGKRGLLEKLKGWIFVEWSKANEWVQDVNYPSNMLYSMMLDAISELYGDEKMKKESDKIKKLIRKYSYDGRFFTDNAMLDENGELVNTGNISEVCQYYAFFCGIADAKTYPELLKTITGDFGPGHKCLKKYPNICPANAFIGNYLRLEILSENGYKKEILEETGEYFDYMAKATGTLWENDSPHASCNHGFASHVAHVIVRDFIGIGNIDNRAKTVYLEKEYAPPANAELKLPLKGGMLEVLIKDGVRAVTAPAGWKIV